MEKKKNTQPGRKSTIARLVILAIFTVIALVTSIGTLPGYIAKLGFAKALLEAIGGCGVLLLTGVWIWGLIKWIVFMSPKSFALAKRFRDSWTPLTNLGVFVKVCIGLIIAIVPITAYAATFSLFYSITFHIARSGLNILTALLLLILGAAAVLITAFWDLCSLKNLSAVEEIKKRFAKEPTHPVEK